MSQHRFGPIVLDYGDGTTKHCPDIAHFPSTTRSEPADVRVRFADELPYFEPRGQIGKGAVSFGQSEIRVRVDADLEYLLRHLFDEGNSTEVVVRSPGTRRRSAIDLAKTARRRWRDGPTPTVAGEIRPSRAASYSLLWFVLHLALRKTGAGFAHGAAWAENNRATVILGSGGCGKTSTLLELSRRRIGQYLAEDFVIVDDQGRAHPSPKPVTLYLSDLESVGSTPEGRHQDSRRVNRKFRVPPSVAFSPLAQQPIAIQNAIFTTRTFDSAFRLDEVSVDELATRSSYSSVRELKHLHELLTMLAANDPEHAQRPSPAALRQDLEELYQQAFSRADTFHLHAPVGAPPSDLVDFLVDAELTQCTRIDAR